jgi:hypothetical protein
MAMGIEVRGDAKWNRYSGLLKLNVKCPEVRFGFKRNQIEFSGGWRLNGFSGHYRSSRLYPRSGIIFITISHENHSQITF